MMIKKKTTTTSTRSSATTRTFLGCATALVQKSWISRCTMMHYGREHCAFPSLRKRRRGVLFTDNCSSHVQTNDVREALRNGAQDEVHIRERNTSVAGDILL